MALFNGVIRSEVLGMDTNISVILPYDRPAENQKTPCKVLYLLHGLGGNAYTWTRETSIERYARDYGIAVVMPEVQKSFYTNMKYGVRYFDYITEELPGFVGEMFNVSQKPEDTYIAGLSMGGYGALKSAMTYPEKYAGCASLSGLTDIKYLRDAAQSSPELSQVQALWGEALEMNEADDIYNLMKTKEKLPPIYLACGTEDYLYAMNVKFKTELETLGLNHKYEEWEGIHNWQFWDVAIQKTLAFFCLQ